MSDTFAPRKLQVPGIPLGAADVANFMGRELDSRLTDAIQTQYLPLVRAMACAYTRGRGFTIDALGPLEQTADIGAVICMAIARLAPNPSQVDQESADGYQVSGAFRGFTIAEQMILNAYRVRST